MTKQNEIKEYDKEFETLGIFIGIIIALLVILLILEFSIKQELSSVPHKVCEENNTKGFGIYQWIKSYNYSRNNNNYPEYPEMMAPKEVCKEVGDKYFVVDCNYTTCYACEHNGNRRLSIHNSRLDKVNVTINDLPMNLHYFMDNDTKYIYNVKEGIINLGVLNYNEKKLLIEVKLDERLPEDVYINIDDLNKSDPTIYVRNGSGFVEDGN